MGAPGEVKEQTEPSLCPGKAPHAAPGSNQPPVAGPCTRLRQGKARLKVDMETVCPSLMLQECKKLPRGSSQRVPSGQSPRRKHSICHMAPYQAPGVAWGSNALPIHTLPTPTLKSPLADACLSPSKLSLGLKIPILAGTWDFSQSQTTHREQPF